ncbi:putative membrane protein [Paenochrobactrum gallinarii]|uniref:Protoporphyrinogen IX oxidase n=1 Tax=Paenochrobactrum gallinarii TaxID=643673 RepID=A0A841LRN1_9HYPH|nr:protoporphyrinogen oxidase HemJ [Paenochrobactrum gallinarii]MBB6260795.1 putative membrane protein [Paenochrobactrum gallinarii]
MSTDVNSSGSKVAIRAMSALAIVLIGFGILFHVNPEGAYNWIKALHVIAIISWMAAMLYLPRLFVYHSTIAVGSETSELFKVMERRLLRVIMNPAMIIAWITGLWMAWDMFAFKGGWLHGKLLLVVLMSAAHGILSKSMRRFAADQNTKSSKYWRIFNEIPTILMILIVILVIVKPF